MNPESHTAPKTAESLDIREASSKDPRQFLDKRLFMQLLVFTQCFDTDALAGALKKSGLEAVLYADANDPRGAGLLFMSEDPAHFTDKVRALLNAEPFRSLTPRPEMTMIGRSYSTGFEPDLEDWLLRKPRRNALNKDFGWAVWYPLRRKPEFEQLSKDEQRAILMEHARLGMAWGQADLAHDIRLACHGLDTHDNEFLLGLVGKELYPLSRLVQEMRKTQQTSRYIQQMGPFFVGRVLGRYLSA